MGKTGERYKMELNATVPLFLTEKRNCSTKNHCSAIVPLFLMKKQQWNSAIKNTEQKTHCSVYVYGKHMEKNGTVVPQKLNSGTKTQNSRTKTLFHFCSVVL